MTRNAKRFCKELMACGFSRNSAIMIRTLQSETQGCDVRKFMRSFDAKVGNLSDYEQKYVKKWKKRIELYLL